MGMWVCGPDCWRMQGVTLMSCVMLCRYMYILLIRRHSMTVDSVTSMLTHVPGVHYGWAILPLASYWTPDNTLVIRDTHTHIQCPPHMTHTAQCSTPDVISPTYSPTWPANNTHTLHTWSLHTPAGVYNTQCSADYYSINRRQSFAR